LSRAIAAYQVAISAGDGTYPEKSPYSPSRTYPEYPFDHIAPSTTTNHAYEGVRDVLQLIELDAEHYGKDNWNPLGNIANPGDTVVLKPNLIRDFREARAGHGDCLITHGSVIRAVLDYVYIAIKGEGRIVIADAPQNDADFAAIRRMAGLDRIQQFYREHANFGIEVIDLRPERAKKIDGVIVDHEQLPGDPAGYVKVDLGRHSMFTEVEHLCHLLYGSEYETKEICRHHTGGVHEYLVSKTVLDADCIINLPKLKTHKKTGITASMKNLVGINGNKNWLPHHRLGTPAQGGDQFADDGVIHRIERTSMAFFRRVFPFLGPMRGIIARPLKSFGKVVFGDTNTTTIRSGNWYGNDTTWRMVIDLNRILLYSDENGDLMNSPARQLFCIVDGIVGGEGNGPLDPTAKTMGMILAGMNPLALDLACARLMNFDYQKIPVLFRALEEHSLPLTTFDYTDIICRSSDPGLDCPLAGLKSVGSAFEPHFGWKGHIELTQRPKDTEKK